MRSALKTWCVITLAWLTVSGCARTQLTVPNLKFYGDKGKFGTTEVESLHPEKPGVRYPKSVWDEMRIGMICTPAENIRTLQTIIDKLCAANRTACYYAKDGVDEVQKAFGAAIRSTKE